MVVLPFPTALVAGSPGQRAATELLYVGGPRRSRRWSWP
jgi:hypothetical protein